MSAWRIGALLLAFITYGFFDWAAGAVFRKVGKPERRLSLLLVSAALSQLAVLACISRAPLRAPYVVAGAIGYVLSLGLFTQSIRQQRSVRLSLAYSRDLPEYLLTSGPYRRVRHPCYTAYLMSYASGVLMTAQPLLLIPTFVMLALYVNAALYEEGKFEHSALRDAYATYRDNAGLLTPRLSPRG